MDSNSPEADSLAYVHQRVSDSLQISGQNKGRPSGNLSQTSPVLEHFWHFIATLFTCMPHFLEHKPSSSRSTFLFMCSVIIDGPSSQVPNSESSALMDYKMKTMKRIGSTKLGGFWNLLLQEAESYFLDCFWYWNVHLVILSISRWE